MRGPAATLALVVLLAACGDDSVTSRGAGGSAAASGGSGAVGSGPSGSTSGGLGGAGGGGGAGPGTCSGATPGACRRGLYASLYTDHVGQIDFTGPLAGYAYILGDAAKEQRVLDYIAAHDIDALSLYDLSAITAAPGSRAALASFMQRARAAGVTSIEAIGSTTNTLWDAIAQFHEQDAPFDGVVTEIEFWSSGSVADVTDALDYVRQKQLAAPSGKPFVHGCYIGWPEDADVAALVGSVDRLYVHVYVDAAPKAYEYGSERFAAIAAEVAAQGRPVDVVPIFSAEGVMWSAGSEHFMGEWLSANGIGVAESAFLADWDAGAPALALTGFQTFELFFLEQYVP